MIKLNNNYKMFLNQINETLSEVETLQRALEQVDKYYELDDNMKYQYKKLQIKKGIDLLMENVYSRVNLLLVDEEMEKLKRESMKYQSGLVDYTDEECPFKNIDFDEIN